MVSSEGRLFVVSTASPRMGHFLEGRKEQMSGTPYNSEETGRISDCKSCNHPLINHGDFPEDPCDCWSGRIWEKAHPDLHTIQKSGPKGRRDGRIQNKFRQIPDFPEYMINRQGCVKYIATGQYCLFLRLTSSGGAMISLQQNGRAVPITVQELVAKTFGSPSRPKGNDD